MKYICLVFLLGLIGCGKEPGNPGEVNIDPTFSAYVQKFKDEGESYGLTITIANIFIHFGDASQPPNQPGRCDKKDEFKEVIINKEHWKFYDEFDKQIVIYHELGHCILNRRHRDDIISIMNTYKIWSSIYKFNYSKFNHELFLGN